MTGLRYQRCGKYKEVSLNCTVTLNPKQSRTGERRDLYTHAQTYTRTFSSGWPLMHTNGFCHLWRGKIYSFLRQAVNRATQQKTLASLSILRGLHMKDRKLSCCVGGGETAGTKIHRSAVLLYPPAWQWRCNKTPLLSTINPIVFF